MNAELARLRDAIRRNKSYDAVDLTLQQIDQEFGPVEVNKAIRDFKLKRLGFEEEFE